MKLEIFIYLLLVISVIAEDEDVHDESAEIKSAEVDVESELIQIDSQKYFDKFTLRYEKEYENDTVLAEGMVNFDGNWNAIKAHNELAQMDLVPFTMKPQPFMDEPLEKVRDRLCGLIVPEVVTPRNLPFGPPPPKTFYPPAPKSKNWCYLHDEVRDQQDCGACWSFATVAVVEAQLNRVRGQRVYLSEQQLIDCDVTNSGCSGGWPTDALNYVQKTGMSHGSHYPYQNAEGACQVRRFTKIIQPRPFIKITEEPIDNDEEKMKRIIFYKGPAVAAIYVDLDILPYSTGVYISDGCPRDSVNHAVVICGYGDDPVFGPYWIVRNSWGPAWGENGYVRIARGRNTCGIASTYLMFPEL